MKLPHSINQTLTLPIQLVVEHYIPNTAKYRGCYFGSLDRHYIHATFQNANFAIVLYQNDHNKINIQPSWLDITQSGYTVNINDPDLKERLNQIFKKFSPLNEVPDN